MTRKKTVHYNGRLFGRYIRLFKEENRMYQFKMIATGIACIGGIVAVTAKLAKRIGEQGVLDTLKAAPAFVDHKPGKTRVMAINPSAMADMISEYGTRDLSAKIIDDYEHKNPGAIMWSETWDVDDD